LVIFKDGIAEHRIVGFNELGGNDDFPTMQLARNLKKKGALEEPLTFYGDRQGDDSGTESD